MSVVPTLLSLPRELRDRIFEFTLTYEAPLIWKPNRQAQHSSPGANGEVEDTVDTVRPLPSLFLVCSQIHDEAQETFQKCNTFVFEVDIPKHLTDSSKLFKFRDISYRIQSRGSWPPQGQKSKSTSWCGDFQQVVDFTRFANSLPLLRRLRIDLTTTAYVVNEGWNEYFKKRHGFDWSTIFGRMFKWKNWRLSIQNPERSFCAGGGSMVSAVLESKPRLPLKLRGDDVLKFVRAWWTSDVLDGKTVRILEGLKVETVGSLTRDNWRTKAFVLSKHSVIIADAE